MKLFTSLIVLLMTSLSLCQEVVQSTRSIWAGGPCCIHGIKWTTSIKVPKNSKVEIVSAHSKANGWADVSLWEMNDTTIILIGNYQYNDGITIDNKEIKSVNKTEASLEYEGCFYWQIKMDGQAKEIIIEDYEELHPIAYP